MRPLTRHRVRARGSSLSAGPPRNLSGPDGDRRRSPGLAAQVLGGKLAAGGVYVLAAARTQRGRESQLPRAPQECLRIALGGSREARVRPVETPQVEVVERVVEKPCEFLHVPRLIVHP